LCRGASC